LTSLQLDEETRNRLAKWANMGLAKKTWSSYKTAERMLGTCMKAKGRKLEIPVSREDILLFVDWLISERGVKAATIESYLAGIRQMHIVKGIDPPVIKSDLVKLVVKGRANADAVEKRKAKKPERKPITMKVMALLKECIRRWEKPQEEKLLIWAVCTLAFGGSFRIGELLCRSEKAFDPDFDLLTEDIAVVENGKENTSKIVVKLKCPKENKKGPETIVDVFQTDNCACPVKAFRKWQEKAAPEKGQPLFRRKDGKPLTGRTLNRILKELLSPHFDYKKGFFTTHSFRAGIPSMMGAMGMANDDIKATGRWSSRAYEFYVKKPRTIRMKVAKKIAKAN